MFIMNLGKLEMSWLIDQDVFSLIFKVCLADIIENPSVSCLVVDDNSLLIRVKVLSF